MTKILLSVAVSLLTFQAQANGFTVEQKKVVAEAIANTCGYIINLKQLGQTHKTVVVDQGIRDVYTTTVFEGDRRLDQNVFDRYEITVNSLVSDAYDHQNGNWGIFTVESVNCTPAQQ